MFQHLVEHAPDGTAVEHLDHVHRFDAEWEAAASLRLRQGDVTALDDYDERAVSRAQPRQAMAVASLSTDGGNSARDGN